MTPPDTTDITLFVRTSAEDVAPWNRQRIVDALVRETSIDLETAEAVSREVEQQIVSSGIGRLTTALVRELVDARLVERGLEKARRLHARVGFPLYDVRELLFHRNRENANLPHGPEGTNLLLAEGIKREFALHEVFTSEVGDAHIAGDIHLHGLGFVDRPYRCCQSLEYLKKFGLNLSPGLTVARPARHAEVLLAHMVRFSAMLQGHFAGVVAWDAVNVSFAPFLAGMDDREVRQLAQLLLFEFSQLTAPRGGQTMFADIHLVWDVPPWLAGVPALGPGGKETGKTYRDFLGEARRFARALCEVFREGDGLGRPFLFPRPLIHLAEEDFRDPDHAAFLALAAGLAAEKGTPCFVFDRRRPAGAGGTVQTRPGGGQGRRNGPPWRRRFAALQNVSLNLPRLGYRSGGDDRRLFVLLSEAVELAARAHRQKRDFLEKLLSYGEQGPLALLATGSDGEPYLRLREGTCLLGMVGLNELVRLHRGKGLHESDRALAFGLKVVGHLHKEAERLGRQEGLAFALEQTPAEATSYRFARLDLRYFSPLAGRHVRGDLSRGEMYYTNSTHLDVSAPVAPLERVRREGLFHPLITAEVGTHLWLGPSPPDPRALAEFLRRVLRETENRQVDFSPEFTVCAACGATASGLQDACPACGSVEVDGVARISQYFSRVSGWNRGKQAELRDRCRTSAL